VNLDVHDPNDLLLIFCAVVVGVGSVARTARLIAHDTFPPVAIVRERILARYAEESRWSVLWECQFCIAPYLTAGMIGWAWWSDLNMWWWLINGWWAASYAAAIVVSYDQPE